jgi:cob(I)alamin adenosyltransferase
VEKGFVHIYYGEGKGKTSAALGLAMRASGAGLRVIVVQFNKGKESSEIKSLNKLGIKSIIVQNETGYVPFMDQDEKSRCLTDYQQCMTHVFELITSDQYDVIILDELLAALETGMVDIQQVVDLIQKKSPQVELVITGRYPTHELIEMADYVSEVKVIKHPYSQGVLPRLGIEY